MQNYNSKFKNKRQSGFTLIEMLVTLAIFSTALIIISNIFVLAGRAQSKSAEIEKVHSGARLAMESMVREVRAGKINYDYYTNGVISREGVSELALLDQSGRSVIFFSGSCDDDILRNCLKINVDGQEADVTGVDSKLVDLAFYIQPLSDPFMSLPLTENDCFDPDRFDEINQNCTCEENSNCYPDQSCDEQLGICLNADTQPSVTIKFVSRAAKSIQGEQPLVALQTTVSTKNYER